MTPESSASGGQTHPIQADRLNYSYYPGCTLHSSSREYDVSTRLVFQKLGLGLNEIEGWTCCGAGVAQSFDSLLALALPARDIDLASKKEWPIAVACAKCFSRLKHTSRALEEKDKAREISRVLEKDSIKPVEVLHILQILDAGKMDIPVKKSLSGLKVASYYGCLLVRPKGEIGFDHEENPTVMDNLVSHTGAEPVQWSFKTECCGAGFNLVRKEIMLKLSHRILKQAKDSGAECMAVACPLCYNNLDTAQIDMDAIYRDDFHLPVLFITELLGLALGIKADNLLLDKHIIDPLPLLKSKGLM